MQERAVIAMLSQSNERRSRKKKGRKGRNREEGREKCEKKMIRPPPPSYTCGGMVLSLSLSLAFHLPSKTGDTSPSLSLPPLIQCPLYYGALATPVALCTSSLLIGEVHHL